MTRQELRTQLLALEKWERRYFWFIVAGFVVPVSVFLSVRQHLAAFPRLQSVLGLSSFCGFMLLMIALSWLHPRRVTRLGLRCPGCREALSGTNAMFVMSTTRCGRCGHQVVYE
jgi:hypothetical protein